MTTTLTPKALTPSARRTLRKPYPSPSSSIELNACATAERLIQQRRRDDGAVRAGVAAVGLDPQGALVVAVQHVLPGEADAPVHLDRPFARGYRRIAAVRLRGSHGELRLRIALGDAPR